MKISRGFRFIIGGLVCLVITALFLGFWQSPAPNEISRAQLDLLLRSKMIREASVTPTVYQDIYEVSGVYSLNPAGEKEDFSITTRLEQAQVHQLMALSGVKVSPEGRVISEAEWNAKVGEWLPTGEDRAFVASLMGRVVEPGKFANWIAPPVMGINRQPVNFEYVRFA